MMKKPWTDPIVEEIRQTREALAREAGYDVKKLGTKLLKTQERHGKKLVSGPATKNTPS